MHITTIMPEPFIKASSNTTCKAITKPRLKHNANARAVDVYYNLRVLVA
jgi:hypothetical protein